ncbi:MAG TPA: TolC family protein, partial [Pirellulaceae bacterium]|nr:TolC family protein [Pirellulaceae bacterium]
MKIQGIVVVTVVFVVAAGCRSPHPSPVTSFRQSPIHPPRSSVTVRDPSPVEHISYEQSESQPDETTVHAAISSFNDASPVISGDTQGTITLTELQALAIENNPTIQATAAMTHKAAGYLTQVGLRPNPTVGYQAVQLADQGTDQHTLFFERQFIRGGKLELNRQVLNEALKAQRFELDAQQIRVLTDVEIKFYEVLAAQRRVQLVNEFGGVVEKGMELSETRFRAQEGTKVDVLQAKIQKN